jgi:serine protease Do
MIKIYKFFKAIYILNLIILSVIIFQSCSGCSRSGRRSSTKKITDVKSNYSLIGDSTNITDIEAKLNNTSSSLSLPELFKKNKSAVFMVFTSSTENNYQGSGFFISEEGIGISNYHVFEGTIRGLEKLKLESGEILKIDSVLAISKLDDYIVFKVDSFKSRNYINIATELPEIGEQVFAIGNPKGLEHSLSTGIVSSYRGENNMYIQTTTEITNGSSGGPLLNMKGEVIGITTSGLGEANLNFAINIHNVMNTLLDDNNL